MATLRFSVLFSVSSQPVPDMPILPKDKRAKVSLETILDPRSQSLSRPRDTHPAKMNPALLLPCHGLPRYAFVTSLSWTLYSQPLERRLTLYYTSVPSSCWWTECLMGRPAAEKVWKSCMLADCEGGTQAEVLMQAAASCKS